MDPDNRHQLAGRLSVGEKRPEKAAAVLWRKVIRPRSVSLTKRQVFWSHGHFGPANQETTNMLLSRTRALSLGSALFALALASVATASETTVHVSLWDKGQDSATIDPDHPMAMGDMGTDMAMAMLGVTVDVAEVHAGTVTFTVTNDSTNIIHEMILSPVGADGKLVYLDDEFKVDEDGSSHLGEVAELDPGQTGALTVDLTPGDYVLYCNIPGHFVGGMWTRITVVE